jgi:hypothetical protein
LEQVDLLLVLLEVQLLVLLEVQLLVLRQLPVLHLDYPVWLYLFY